MELLFDNAIQFQAKNGTLLTSGRVYVYYRNRTELANVYANYSGTTPLANPVMLDAEGRGSVFVDPAFSYTYVVTDRFGNEQFSIDKEFPNGIPTDGEYVYSVREGDYIHVEESGDLKKTVTVSVSDEAKDILDNAASKDYVDAAAADAKTVVNQGNNVRIDMDVKPDGHFDYTINAQGVNITSPNQTIDINVTTDPNTDTKTFEIDVGSGQVDYFFGHSTNISVTDDTSYELVALANQAVQGTLNPQNLKAGVYVMLATVKYRPVTNTNDLQRVFISAGYPAIQHYDVLDMSYTEYHTKEIAQILILPNDGQRATLYAQFENMPAGRQIGLELYNLSLYRIDKILAAGNVMPGITAVVHDATLTGDGTIEDPLSVADPGLITVSTDTTLTGDGTVNNPLSVANPGITSVATDATLTGTGIVGDPLSVANPGITSVVTDGVTITGTGIVGDPLVAVGGGASYGEGDAIEIDANDDINVLYGDGLAINGDNELEVQLGDGLTFEDDGGIKVITVDSDVSDVVETVEKLKKDLDTQITTNFDMPNISQVYDFADPSVSTLANGACMLCQAFTIPINHEIRTVSEDADEPTLLGVYAQQSFSYKIMLALYEYTYAKAGEQNGSSTYVGDTGPVDVAQGVNEWPLKNRNPSITELRSDKVYYATLYLPNAARVNGLFLAGAPNYGNASVPAEPRLTCAVENITWEGSEMDMSDPTTTLNHYTVVQVPGEPDYYQYYIGPWNSGYNERWTAPRFYMQIRNGEYNIPVVPTVPFNTLGAQLPDSAGLVSTIPGFTPSSSNSVYRDVTPLMNVTITSMEWIDNMANYVGWAAGNCVYDSGYTNNLSGVSNTVTDLGVLVTVDGHDGYGHKITFTSPISLTAGTTYRFLCDTFTSGSDYSFTWSTPADVLDVSDNGWYADYQNMTRFNNYFGKYLKLTDSNNVSYVI